MTMTPTPGNCPACGRGFTHATGHTDQRPEPGDFSLCISCNAVLRFDDDLLLQLFEGELPAEVRSEIHAHQARIRTHSPMEILSAFDDFLATKPDGRPT